MPYIRPIVDPVRARKQAGARTAPRVDRGLAAPSRQVPAVGSTVRVAPARGAAERAALFDGVPVYARATFGVSR